MSNNQLQQQEGEELVPPTNVRRPNDSIAQDVLQNMIENNPIVTTPVLITPVNVRSTRELVTVIPRIRRVRTIETTRSRRTVVRRTTTTRTPTSRVEKRSDKTTTAIELDSNEQEFQDRLDILLETPKTSKRSLMIPTSVMIKNTIRSINRIAVVDNAKQALLENMNIEICLNELENQMKVLEEEDSLINELMQQLEYDIEKERKINLKIELIKEILNNDLV